jgi:hypothetical protein
MSGGFGMFMVLAMGTASIGYGIKAVREPAAERIAALRALPGLLLTASLFTFGTGLWAVNRALSSDTFLKSQNMTAADAPVVGLIGFTEAAQVLTLGGLLAMVVFALRVVAEARHAKASRER